MSRVLLLCGDRGAGVAAHAEATALALEAEGLTVARVTVGAAADASTMAAVAAVMDATLGEIGADALPAEAWAELPGLDALAVLWQMAAAADEHDVVVVDAGDVRDARELVTLPALLVRLLDHVLTPRMAMWRPTGAERQPFDVLSAARFQVRRLEALLHRPSTTIRLLALPDEDDADRVLRAASLFAMLGVGVDGIVLAPFPRKSDGDRERRRAERLLADVTQQAEGVLVWKSTRIARPAPKGRSALGPLGRVHSLDADQLTVHAGDEEFSLELPLMGVARDGARIGVVGERLVLAFDASTRWLDLPPVLQRCTPIEAVRSSSGLRVVFRPDPSLWPAREAS